MVLADCLRWSPGLQLDLQAFTWQPGANARGFVVSNGMQLTAGNQ